jgi:hypothetical protein
MSTISSITAPAPANHSVAPADSRDERLSTTPSLLGQHESPVTPEFAVESALTPVSPGVPRPMRKRRPSLKPDLDDIKRFLRVLHQEGDIVEVRVPTNP